MNEFALKKPISLTPEQFSRLYRMGLVDSAGAPQLLGLEGLASVTSGCL